MSTTAFLTDSTLCIGCKACEVACKEWNQLGEDGFEWSGNSYDNTMAVGHSTWRHVKFVENTPEIGRGGNSAEQLPAWGFSSDVCKHCEVAGCLGSMPYRRDRAHGLWRSIHSAGYLQWLLVLRCELSFWRGGEKSTKMAAHSSAPSALIDRAQDCSRLALRRVQPSRSNWAA